MFIAAGATNIIIATLVSAVDWAATCCADKETGINEAMLVIRTRTPMTFLFEIHDLLDPLPICWADQRLANHLHSNDFVGGPFDLAAIRLATIGTRVASASAGVTLFVNDSPSLPNRIPQNQVHPARCNAYQLRQTQVALLAS